MTPEQQYALGVLSGFAGLIIRNSAPLVGWSLIVGPVLVALANWALRVWWFPIVPCDHCSGSWLCRWCGGFGERYRWEIRMVRRIKKWNAQRREQHERAG